MFRRSLKAQLLGASLLVTALVVGGMALMTFIVVSNGLERVYAVTARSIGDAATSILQETAREAREEAARLPGDAAQQTANAQASFNEHYPALLESAGLNAAEYALYDSSLELIWSSAPTAVDSETREQRRQALDIKQSVSSTEERAWRLRSLFSAARLEVSVLHIPVLLPDGSTGVLDVRTTPAAEESVIDNLRLPMLLMTAAIVLLMLGMMQVSSLGVLRLVDTLRAASDSIEAGRMDERLPQVGNNEVGELSRSVNRLLDRLQRRSEAQAQFVADASHELATPVAGIRGYTSILRAWGADDPIVRAEAIDAIDRESQRMARLTSDLLKLLHADQGIRLKTETFDLNALIRNRIATAATSSIERDIDFMGPEDETLMMSGDPERIEDVVSILTDNAVKYTPSGGSVAVTSRKERDRVVITVSDTGKGIAEEDMGRLFDRFFRSEQARAAGESGFGIGLSIAKSLVDAMGGTIEATSELGQGTTFTVVVPRGRV